MNVTVKEFRIKKMKTRWGTCNPKAKRIWINLELAKKPLVCLQYLIAHEMVHLLERKHNKKFFSHMDSFMPNWRECKNELRNSALH
jgi:predicted metal-dependent hydrolase